MSRLLDAMQRVQDAALVLGRRTQAALFAQALTEELNSDDVVEVDVHAELLELMEDYP